MSEQLTRIQQQEKRDKSGYDYLYSRASKIWSDSDSLDDYLRSFTRELRPFYLGGTTKGYVRSLATETLMEQARTLGKPLEKIRVMDAGCGEGKLSLFLAARGFQVIGSLLVEHP